MFMAWDILPKANLQYFLTKLKNKFLMLTNYNKLGAKNILPFPYAYGSGTVHGLTVTVHEDGSVTASGQPTQNVAFTLVSNIITEYDLQVGDKLIFSESNVENNNASAALIYVSPSGAIDLVQGDYELTITSDMVTRGVSFILWFNTGVDLTTPVTFKPMLRLDTDPDSTWVSPAFTNRKLTELVVYLNRTKSHVSANPSTTTETLTSVEIDGTAYSLPGAGNAQTVTLSKDLEGTANFDSNGVATIDANLYSCSVQSANTNNYPWHRIATITGTTSTYTDKDVILMFQQGYQGGDFGILKISLRTNGSGASCSISAMWMIRYGINTDEVKIAQWGTSGQSVYVDVFFKCSTWMRTKIYQLSGGRQFTLVDSNEVSDTTSSDKKTSVECYVSVESAATEIHNQAYTTIQNSSDVGYVSGAGTAAKAVRDGNDNNIVDTYVKKAGDSMSGPLLVNATGGVGSYDEGIRINAGKNGYATLVIGGTANSTSGTADGQFWLGTNPTNGTYKRKLYIAHAGSTGSGTYFESDSASRVGPALHLGWSGSVANGNAYAVTGGTVYSALSSWVASKASILDGFGSGGAGNFTWGNQTGTGIWRNNDGGGGEFGFRKNNPSNGQVSMVIDGTVYVDEGRYSVIHAGNIGSQSVNYANSAGSATDSTKVKKSGDLMTGTLSFRDANSGAMIWCGGNQQIFFSGSHESNYYLFLGVTDSTWTLCPNGKDYLRLGTSNHRWNQIYSNSTSISTSDRKEKKDIEPLDEFARTLIMSLKPVSFKFINGESGRTHYGMIAQDVEESLEELGITPLDIAAFCKDQKTKQVKEICNGQEKFRDIKLKGEYVYGLRYEEFIGPIIKTEQLQQEDINSLKEEVALLKEEIALLKQRLQILEDK